MGGEPQKHIWSNVMPVSTTSQDGDLKIKIFEKKQTQHSILFPRVRGISEHIIKGLYGRSDIAHSPTRSNVKSLIPRFCWGFSNVSGPGLAPVPLTCLFLCRVDNFLEELCKHIFYIIMGPIMTSSYMPMKYFYHHYLPFLPVVGLPLSI